MKATRVIAALLGAGLFSLAQAATTLSEGFDDVTTLESKGWERWNLSQEPWQENLYYAWFQGHPEAFGAPDPAHLTYAAANYLNTVRGDLSVWLVTPEIELKGGDTLHFSVRSDGEWADGLRVRIGDGSATTAADFHTTILDFGSAPDVWVDFSLGLPQLTDSIRVAFEYYGTFSGANYLGLDSISVTSPVPEPTSALMLGGGLLGLMLARRRKGARELA